MLKSAMLLAYILAIMTIPTPPQEKRWSGIRPLESTREDVIRLLGHSANGIYNFEDEIITFVYSSGPCEKGMRGWNVPASTVISIMVAPRVKWTLSELQIDVTKYQKVDHPSGYVYYSNKEEGLTISTYDNRVTYFEYGPSVKDEHLRCPGPGPVARPEEGPVTYPLGQLDMYGDVPFELEQARLDILASQLQIKPDTRGYIIVYAGQRARVSEAQSRAGRAKAYLIRQRGIDPDRVFAVDGGYRKELTVEIWFGSRGAPAPIPSPTLRRRDVKIIK